MNRIDYVQEAAQHSDCPLGPVRPGLTAAMAFIMQMFKETEVRKLMQENSNEG